MAVVGFEQEVAMYSCDAAEQRDHAMNRSEEAGRSAHRRHEVVERDAGVVVFRCEACDRDIHDLRGVFFAHRGGDGWRIECSRHSDAPCELEAGLLFGGGLHSVEVLSDLARARWFEAADFFMAILRLRAQASGLYVRPASDRG